MYVRVLYTHTTAQWPKPSFLPPFKPKLHGAAYGKGIYLSPISSISFGYSGRTGTFVLAETQLARLLQAHWFTWPCDLCVMCPVITWNLPLSHAGTVLLPFASCCTVLLGHVTISGFWSWGTTLKCGCSCTLCCCFFALFLCFLATM